MRHRSIATALLAAAATLSAHAFAAEAGDFTLDIGGRLKMSGDPPGDPGDFDWVLDVNYLDDTNDTELHAAGVRYTGWRVANVFFGRTKEPFGLEGLISSKAISTMRRNLFTGATDTDAQPHHDLLLDGFVGPVGWSMGAFNPDGNPTTDDGSDRIAFTGRAFGAPGHR